ncbi:hypothetical protein BGZ70_000666 [Mortierella alpina]|uniref:G-protein coupled receptors family 3 profile domain-containing protein n=1 Tax=Mortierella alpina TaxID=64518 RepID=A0A9P6IXZ8_MORAP|nr:hypothetical protein BGZ70_000666 [Mortierella alpina]
MQKPRLLTEYEYETMWDPDLRTLRLGVLLPFNTPAVGPTSALVRHGLTAIRLAVDDVNKLKIIPGINMSIIVRDSQEPSLHSKTGGSAAIAGAGRLISAKVGGVVGDIRSELTRYEALMTSSVRIPQCSYASDNPALSNIEEYPYFYRTIPTSLVLIDAVLAVVKSMGWKRIYLIRDPEYLGWIDYFYKTASEMGIYIVAQESLATSAVPSDSSFQSQEADAKAYNGLIMIDIGWDLRDYKPFQDFRSRWSKLDPKEYPGGGTTALNNDEGMAYSCVLMLANAYGELVKRTLPDSKDHVPDNSFIREVVSGDHTDSICMSETYRNSTYEGPAGPISLDKNGDRKDGFYVAQSMDDGKPVQFGFFMRGNFTFTSMPFKNTPSDAPRWTLQNPQWSSNAGIACGVLSMLVIALILISAALVLYFRNHIAIKASSPTFCLLELLGILLVIVWCLLHVGVPSSSTCIANSFILVLGVTLLTGSLTIKSYRIYRIFNSVNFAHQTFQTRILLRYMGLIVVLCMITPIIEMATDPPQPVTLNVGSIQWVRCRGYHSQMWWSIISSIVPAILLLFGVYFAIKTRNVMFLWNEARQITLVLYNIFFFAILVIASQFFPYDIYLATYYITLIGTYVVATLALLILFVPKLLSIRKSRQKSWGHGDRPNEEHNQHSAASPSDRVRARVAAMTRIPANISAGAGRLRQTVIDGDTVVRSNRVDQNPLYAWMGSQMPHRGSLMTLSGAEQQQLPVNGRLVPRSSEDRASGREDSFTPWKRRFCSENEARLGGEEGVDALGECAGAQDQCEESGLPKQLINDNLAREQALGDSDTGIKGKFLLPVRIIKYRFTDALSHWTMQTLILTPEAHAFLSVDCTNGHSTSYLMHSMVQEKDELVHPTLRVATCHTGALLIQFSSQAHLDAWMGLFSEQDLNALGAHSFITTPPYQQRSSISSTVLDAASRRQPSNTDLNMTYGSTTGVKRFSEEISSPFTHIAESKVNIDAGPVPHPLATLYASPSQIEKDEGDASSSSAYVPLGAQPMAVTTVISRGLDDKDDEDPDDLYDPEFGIGAGIGRRKRRQQSRSMSHSLRGGATPSSSGTSATIPSAAVISAAAAAVAEGWSESDALAAAMANPSLNP